MNITNSPYFLSSFLKSILFFSFVWMLLFTLSLTIKSAPLPISSTPFEFQPSFFDPPLSHASWNKIIFKMKNESRVKNWEKPHVVEFFKNLTPIVIPESLETGVPPAALLAIAALESGYNTGYVGRITGNILSLNALDNEVMLPALQLYFYPKTQQVMLDPQKIKKLLDSGILLDCKTVHPL
jgi:hypothetical protein